MDLNKQDYRDEVAVRFRSARCLVKLTRKDFCAKYGISPNTVQGWEVGKNVANPRQVKRFLASLASEGVFCTTEWLLHGQGTPPSKVNLQQSMEMLNKALSADDEAADSAKTEASNFIRLQKKAGRKAISIHITDDTMAPQFERGDLVAGVFSKSPETLATHICIVEVSPGAFIVRRLLCDGSRFLLVPADFTKPVISLEKLTNAAKVVWQRKPLA